MPCISSESASAGRAVIGFFTVKRNTSRAHALVGEALARSRTSTPSFGVKSAAMLEEPGRSTETGTEKSAGSLPFTAVAVLLVMVPVRPRMVAVGAQSESGTFDATRTSSSFSEHGKKFFCSTYLVEG
jgi:hypothetical protein